MKNTSVCFSPSPLKLLIDPSIIISNLTHILIHWRLKFLNSGGQEFEKLTDTLHKLLMIIIIKAE
jgi:hypothetical protein